MSEHTITDLPMSCANRNNCHASFMKTKYRDDELGDARRTLAKADERIVALEEDLLVRTRSAELSRAGAAIKALQAADVAQRKTIDNLAGETYELRNILRAKGFDMAEVQAQVSESLAKYRLAIAADA